MKRALVIAVAAALACAGCGGSDSPSAEEPEARQETPSTVGVAGKLVLKDVQFGRFDSGQPCSGTGGYSDIRGGAPVVIRNAKGEQLGLGQLEPGGAVQGPLRRSYYCEFRFRVPDIEAEGETFSVEVSDRGQVPFTRDQFSSVEITLG